MGSCTTVDCGFLFQAFRSKPYITDQPHFSCKARRLVDAMEERRQQQCRSCIQLHDPCTPGADDHKPQVRRSTRESSSSPMPAVYSSLSLVLFAKQGMRENKHRDLSLPHSHTLSTPSVLSVAEDARLHGKGQGPTLWSSGNGLPQSSAGIGALRAYGFIGAGFEVRFQHFP